MYVYVHVHVYMHDIVHTCMKIDSYMYMYIVFDSCTDGLREFPY